MNNLTVLLGTDIKDEEDWTGFLVRQSALSSLDGYHGLSVAQGTPSHRAAFVHPSRIKQTASLLPGSSHSWRQVVMSFTRFRLNSAFLSEDGKAGLLEHHRNGARAGAHALIGMNRWAGRARLAVCLSCIDEDLETHTFPIWHRLHLMPSVLYCPTHGEPLRTFCRGCDKGHRRGTKTWTPMEKCLCGKPLRKVASFRSNVSVRAAIEIARMADEVLKGHVDTTGFAEHTGPVIKAALWRQLQKWHPGHGKLAVSHIRRALGSELCVALELRQRTLTRMSGRQMCRGPLRNPIENIAAIWSYFGGWAQFMQEVRLRKSNPQKYDATGRPQVKRVRSRPDDYDRARRAAMFESMSDYERERFRQVTRRTLLAIRASNLNFKRSDVQRLPCGERYYYFALRHDAAWFDRFFPVRGAALIDGAVRNTTAEEDSKTARRVLKRYRKTLREKPETFISRAFLLDNTVSEAVGRTKRTPPSRLEAMLEACVDDLDSWTKRQVKNITTAVRRIDKTCRWADAKSFEAPKRRGVRYRLNEAKKWLHEHSE